jgi:hypothetical protein
VLLPEGGTPIKASHSFKVVSQPWLLLSAVVSQPPLLLSTSLAKITSAKAVSTAPTVLFSATKQLETK